MNSHAKILFYFSRSCHNINKIEKDTKLKKSLNIAIVGLINAGKSQLFNTLIGKNISSVSSKIATTNRLNTGIVNIDNVQLVFTDTPGYTPANECKKQNINFEDSISYINLIKKNSHDLLLHVVDSHKMFQSAKNSYNMLKLYSKSPMTKILVINKVDIEDNKVPNIIWNNIYKYFPPNKFAPNILFHGTTCISSKTGYGIQKLLDYLCALAKDRQWKYSQNIFTTLSLEDQIKERLRQLFFEFLPYNLPYKTYSHIQLIQDNEKINIIVTITSKSSFNQKIILYNISKIETNLNQQILHLLGHNNFKLKLEIYSNIF